MRDFSIHPDSPERAYLDWWKQRNDVRGDEEIVFRGRPFFIPQAIFSPNAETTYSTTILLSDIDSFKGKTVLDLGTGSGAVAVTAASEGAASVTAADIDDHALATARRNAEMNNVADKVEFVKSDVFSSIPGLYDIIFFNLPISDELWAHLGSDVGSVASRFFHQFQAHLKPGGHAYAAYASFGNVGHIRKTLTDIHIPYTERTETRFGVTWSVFRFSGV